MNSRLLSRIARVALFPLLGTVAHASYTGPVPAPADAFGGPGPYAVVTDTFPSPDWPGQVVTVFRPDGAPGPRPTWFFAHGFGGTNPVYYQELLAHLASHGEVVVFSPYPTELLRVSENYATIYDGFVAAAQRYPDLIDTSRVGFAGHSYGGGAVPALALRALREKGWGRNGMALLLLAPWYSYFVTDADLASFPAGTQAVVETYEDDTMNDHRMAIDLFSHLGIAAADKDYLMLRSDRLDGYNYAANHLTPTGAGNPRGGAAFDALDAWGVLRIAQALGMSAWQHDAAGRAIALGHGSAAQTAMGTTAAGRALRPLVENPAPVPLFPSSRYLQPWSGALNPRAGVPLPANPAHAHLGNLSIRADVSDAGEPLIVGAAIQGSRPLSLLVRAVGPTLTQFGVPNPTPNPTLTTYQASATDIALDDWGQSPDGDALKAATAETGAFPLPDGSHDAALLASFSPGTLTVHAGSTGTASGVTLVELYAADDDPSSASLVNVSARAHVGSGDDVLIAGFVTSGPGEMPLLIRAVGPALSEFGVTDAIADPQLEIYRDGDLVASNDDWSADPAQSAAIAHAASLTGAFPLPDGSRDASLMVTLPPGVYSAVVRSKNGPAGEALVEVYAVPADGS
ncbi:MAG TPA: hypothetical protein VHE61_21620 [Opitutaceae bacterium]|nr:hypothetical protein [Opitutaceae bacterium]